VKLLENLENVLLRNLLIIDGWTVGGSPEGEKVPGVLRVGANSFEGNTKGCEKINFRCFLHLY
jgi:hypothetical protein